MVFPCLLTGLQRRRIAVHALLAHIPLGVDFRGGTLVYVKFAQTPDLNPFASAMDRAGLKEPQDPELGARRQQRSADRARQRETSEPRSTRARTPSSRRWNRRTPQAGKQDLNNTGPPSLQQYLLQNDPLHLGTDAPARTADRAADRRLPQQAARRRPELGGRVERRRARRKSLQLAAAGLLHLELRGAQRRDRRPAGRRAAPQAGALGDPVFAGAACWCICGSASS